MSINYIVVAVTIVLFSYSFCNRIMKIIPVTFPQPTSCPPAQKRHVLYLNIFEKISSFLVTDFPRTIKALREEEKNKFLSQNKGKKSTWINLRSLSFAGSSSGSSMLVILHTRMKHSAPLVIIRFPTISNPVTFPSCTVCFLPSIISTQLLALTARFSCIFRNNDSH